MNLKERAEEYTDDEIENFDMNVHELGYHKKRIWDFLASDSKKIFHLYAERGRGKTFLVRVAMRSQKEPYTYISYFKSRKIPDEKTLATDKILVIDDIHYMVDDLKEKKVTTHEIVMLMVGILKRAIDGKKTIIVSEDVFTQNYIPNTRYRNIYKHFCTSELCEELAICNNDVRAVCKNLGLGNRTYLSSVEQKYADFMEWVNPTPRGITAFIMKYGTDWDALLDSALKAYKAHEEAYCYRIAKKTTNAMRKDKINIEIARLKHKMGIFIEMRENKIPENLRSVLSPSSINWAKKYNCEDDYDQLFRLLQIDLRAEINALMYVVYSSVILSKQGYYKELSKMMRGTIQCGVPQSANI